MVSSGRAGPRQPAQWTQDNPRNKGPKQVWTPKNGKKSENDSPKEWSRNGKSPANAAAPVVESPTSVHEIQKGLDTILKSFHASKDLKLSFNGDDLFNGGDSEPSPTDPSASYSRDLMLQAWRKQFCDAGVPRTPEKHTRTEPSTCSTYDEYAVTPDGFAMSSSSLPYDPTAYAAIPQWPLDDSVMPGEVPTWPFELEGPAVDQDPDVIAAAEPQVKKQVEFYFSENNIATDNFLRSKMDDDGWVSLEDIVQFPRVYRLGLCASGVAAALLGSKVVEVSWDTPPRIRMRNSEEREKYSRIDPSTLPSTTDADTVDTSAWMNSWCEDGTAYGMGMDAWDMSAGMDNQVYTFDYGWDIDFQSQAADSAMSPNGDARQNRNRRRARRGERPKA